MTTPERKPCGTCGRECSVNADGTIRHHSTKNPDFQAGPDSNRCKGAGQPPAGAAEDAPSGAPQCRICKHPVQLTGNGRARSHLTTEQTPRQCPGGSDFPLGTYPDIVGTTDGLVATIRAECDHVPVGQCYACYGEAGNSISDAELESMEEAQGTGAAPWGFAAEGAVQPTMADQLKAAVPEASPEDDARDRWQTPNEEWARQRDDGRSEAEQFRSAEKETLTGGPMLRARMADVIATDYRTPEQKARDARTSELTAKAIKVLEQRTPEQKAETAARMDRIASAVLGLPLDPALNPSASRRPAGYDPRCEECNTDNHRCKGCGDSVPHGTVACTPCDRRVMANRLPKGETEDGRPCFHDDAQFGLEGDQLVCVACGTPCTHPDGFTENDPVEDDGEGLVFRCGLCGAVDSGDELPDADQDKLGKCTRCGEPRDGHGHDVLDELTRQQAREDAWRTPAETVRELMPANVQGLDALRLNCAGCGHPVTPLVEAFDLYGKAKAVVWVCERAQHAGALTCDNGGHECKPNTQARLGDLDEGDYFVRRGALMRLTERESRTSVLAVVVGGPYNGRTGELKNLNEMVERAPAPQTKEQETTECPDDRTQTQQPPSSARTTTTTVPAPGSPQDTKESARAVLPQSTSVTSSAPTAKAAGNGRSAAAMTTDQSAAAAAFLGGGRPAATQATGAPNQADAAAQFLAGGSGAHGEKETKRDRFGRYLIPHPDTGKEQAWTRATTFAKSISDTYALSQWGLRMCLLGATMRPDLVQRAHGKHVRADKKLLDELTAELKTAAGDKVAANLGTSMHSFTEMADRAWHSPGGPFSVLDQIPPDCQPMVGAYIQLLKETGLEPVTDLIEFTTVVKQYGVAGTSDNCYKVTRPLMLKIGRAEIRLNPGEYVIGDKKTGRDLDYGWQEIAIQLATYAQGLNTCGRWDRHEEKWHPDPLNGAKVRLDAGIVVHLPVDPESEKQPAVYGLDLESGWNAAVLCERVRAWRNVRTLASPVMVTEAADTFAPSRPEPAVVSHTTVRPASLKDRANNVTSKGEASAVWKDAKTAGLPEVEINELVDIMQARLKKLAEPGG